MVINNYNIMFFKVLLKFDHAHVEQRNWTEINRNQARSQQCFFLFRTKCGVSISDLLSITELLNFVVL